MFHFEELMRAGGAPAIAQATRFFMGDDPVHQALRGIAARLEESHVPYAVCGGMALAAHGYVRNTTDIDILVTPQGLVATHAALEGLGYLSPFAGSKNPRDVANGVRIEFLVTGQFPGDGRPKPVTFPNPAEVSIEIDGIQYLSLPTLVDLKLASGMTNPLRIKDIADVLELMQSRQLPRDFADRLSPYVREKFLELHDSIRNNPNPDDR